jgi:hypothetical protein
MQAVSQHRHRVYFVFVSCRQLKQFSLFPHPILFACISELVISLLSGLAVISALSRNFFYKFSAVRHWGALHFLSASKLMLQPQWRLPSRKLCCVHRIYSDYSLCESIHHDVNFPYDEHVSWPASYSLYLYDFHFTTLTRFGHINSPSSGSINCFYWHVTIECFAVTSLVYDYQCHARQRGMPAVPAGIRFHEGGGRRWWVLSFSKMYRTNN